MSKNEYIDEYYLDENVWASILSEDENNFDNGNKEKLYNNLSIIELGKLETDWDFVELLLDNHEIIECQVIDFNHGGLLVKHEKFKGFIPISHLEDSSLIEKEKIDIDLLQDYLDKYISVRVIEFETNRNRIVLSERSAKTDPDERNILLDKIKIGSELKGKITNIKDFGIFVDLGGLEGLIHISEISWGRVKNPKKNFKIGQEIKVKIIEIDKSTKKISLSIKYLLPNPWESISKKYPKGKNFVVSVIGLAKYGIFVKLEDGLEGLIHISEIKLIDGDQITDIIEIGEEVLVEMISVDVFRQRMSLRLVD